MQYKDIRPHLHMLMLTLSTRE